MHSTELHAHDSWEAGNLEQALSLFLSAFRSGSKSCAINIGYFYDEGLGRPKSKSSALFWYQQAHLYGDSSAATNAAIICRERHQLKRMFSWYRKACRRDDGDAELDIAKCFVCGIGVVRSRARAIEHLQRALKSNHITQAGKEEALFLHRRLTGRSTRTPRQAMPSAFSWPAAVPSALRAPAPVN